MTEKSCCLRKQVVSRLPHRKQETATLGKLPLMRRNGLKICLGTDSLSSNDDLDMIKEIICLHENFPEVPMNEIFTWACLNGARFLMKDSELGSLSVGKRPGIVVVRNIDADGCVTSASTSERII